MAGKRLIDSRSPSSKPDTALRGFRELDRTPPPDYKDFKAVRSVGFKGLRKALAKKTKRT